MSNLPLKDILPSAVCKSVPSRIILSVENLKLFNKLVFLFNTMKNGILIEWHKVKLLDVDIHIIKEEISNHIIFKTTTQIVTCPLPSIIFTKQSMLDLMTIVYNIQLYSEFTPEAEFLQNLIMEMMCMIYNNVKPIAPKMRYLNKMYKKYTDRFKVQEIQQELKNYHNHT
jgi:hypothetical protein